MFQNTLNIENFTSHNIKIETSEYLTRDEFNEYLDEYNLIRKKMIAISELAHELEKELRKKADAQFKANVGSKRDVLLPSMANSLMIISEKTDLSSKKELSEEPEEVNESFYGGHRDYINKNELDEYFERINTLEKNIVDIIRAGETLSEDLAGIDPSMSKSPNINRELALELKKIQEKSDLDTKGKDLLEDKYTVKCYGPEVEIRDGKCVVRREKNHSNHNHNHQHKNISNRVSRQFFYKMSKSLNLIKSRTEGISDIAKTLSTEYLNISQPRNVKLEKKLDILMNIPKLEMFDKNSIKNKYSVKCEGNEVEVKNGMCRAKSQLEEEQNIIESFTDKKSFFSLNLLVKSILFGCLFYIFSHKKTTSLLRVYFSNLKYGDKKIIFMLLFLISYYCINLLI